MTKNPLIPLASALSTQTRIIESLGVPFTDPFNEIGIISDVNDPKKIGRVKVTTKDGLVSDWISVSGSNSGTLSARYIGAQVVLGKISGRSEDMYVVGVVRGDPEVGVVGNPLQLPVIDESMAVWSGSSDQGMSCNEGNEGRAYILSNEMNQDVVVCLRRTNKQVGSKPAWAWKSITSGLWVEKGINPGNETTSAISQSQRNNPGIPECSEALLGEVHEFTEDRGFRTTTMVCRRDENKNFSWLPIGAPPVYFRTTLPNCSEKTHGMEAILDDGNNSEFLVCQRYQGRMSWIKQGRRLPHKFYGKDNPLSRVEFLEGFKSVSALEEEIEPAKNYDWVSEVSDTVFDVTFQSVPITGTDPRLRTLLQSASLIPSNAFDGADTVKRVAEAVVSKRTGLPIAELTTILRAELDESEGVLTPATAKALEGIGNAADVLVNGVKTGNVEDALVQVGAETLRNSLLSLEPRAASVMTGLISGGIVGAVDSAVAIGLDQLPPEVNRYVSPVVDVAKDLLLSKYPSTLNNVLNSAVKGGLSGVISSSINKAIGTNIASPQLINGLTSALTTGKFGPVSQLFGSFSNLNQIAKMPEGLESLPILATTALGVLGQSESMTNLLGGGGVGFDQLNSMVGGSFNAARTIIDGVKGLRGVLGSSPASSECPCDPKCRKTAHGEDSDNNNLLEKCGAATSNNANAYSPVGDPMQNNTGPIAEEQGVENTEVGRPLEPPNRKDATGYIENVARAKEMAEKFFASRFADQTEKELEFAYTFEAVEKGLKTIDNNITGVESIERRLIDVLYNFLSDIVYDRRRGGYGVMTNLIRDVRENSQAIRDLYYFVERLDGVKYGGRAGVRVTPYIAKAFQNIPDLAALSRLTREQALRMLRGGVIPADREWRALTPGKGYQSSLGVYGPEIPSPYPNETTLFNQNRILSEVAKSKLTDTGPNDPTLLERVLSRDQVDTLKRIGFSDAVEYGQNVLNGLDSPLTDFPDTGESTLYDTVIGREGQTDCE